MSTEGLNVSAEGSILRLTIDRGSNNSFSGAMIEELTDLIQRPQVDQRFLLIEAKGENFCLGRDPEPGPPMKLRQVGARISECNEAMRRSRLITVCKVEGDAAGFGVGLMASADVVIAADSARFWFPELDNGLPPSVVISWLARQTSRKRCFDLVASGRRFSGEEAVELGVVSEVVSRGEVAERVDSMLASLADHEQWALAMTKRLILQAQRTPESVAVDWAPDALTLGALQIAADR